MSTHVISETVDCPVCSALLDLLRELQVERYRPTPPKPTHLDPVLSVIEQDRSHA